MRETAKMYCSCDDSTALALAASVLYLRLFCADCAPKKAAYDVFLQCTSEMKPRSDSSFSRRSVIATSAGHFSATSPSSVLKVWVGRLSTRPPPSTPRMAAHQPNSPKALVSRTPKA